MRILSSILVILAVAVAQAAPVVAEPANNALQASPETLSSIKKMKASLNESTPKTSNPVKDTVRSWADSAEERPEPKSNAVRMLQGLGFCVGLFFIGVSIAKRINPKLKVVSEQRMCVRSRMPLTNKTQLILAEVDGREVLIAVGQEQVALLQTEANKTAPRIEALPGRQESGKEKVCLEELQRSA